MGGARHQPIVDDSESGGLWASLDLLLCWAAKMCDSLLSVPGEFYFKRDGLRDHQQ
jgi:hypothetical protein